MSHPDSAWTPWYQAPRGIEEDPCAHSSLRQRIGPTGRRKNFMILTDSCWKCGRILRTVGKDLHWKEYDWVRRFNMRVK